MKLVDQLKEAHKNGQTIEVTKNNGDKIFGEVHSISTDHILLKSSVGVVVIFYNSIDYVCNA